MDNPRLRWIRSCTNDYVLWLRALHIHENIRGWNMHRDRRDWEITAALYKAEKRGALR